MAPIQPLDASHIHDGSRPRPESETALPFHDELSGASNSSAHGLQRTVMQAEASQAQRSFDNSTLWPAVELYTGYATHDAGLSGAPAVGAAAQPGDRQSTLVAAAQGTFANPNSTAQDKLAAIETLGQNGINHFQMADANGQMRDYSIQLEKVKGSDREMVHLFSKDNAGHSHIVMRGIENGDGTFSQERSRNGQHVSFEGDWWSKHMAGLTTDMQHPNAQPHRQPNDGQPADPPPPDQQPQRHQPRQPHQRHRRHHAPSEPVQPGQPPQPPNDAPTERPTQPPAERSGSTVRDSSDRNTFYTAQHKSYNCSAVAMSMMASDWKSGHPPTDRDVNHMEAVAQLHGHGYRGSAADMAREMESQGLQARGYDLGSASQSTIQRDLDAELAQGHTVVAGIRNPHTGNNHYIYIAGKDANGNYIIGDPDRHNNSSYGHDRPVSPQHLLRMMQARAGGARFVAGWLDPSEAGSSPAGHRPGTAAYDASH